MPIAGNCHEHASSLSSHSLALCAFFLHPVSPAGGQQELSIRSRGSVGGLSLLLAGSCQWGLVGPEDRASLPICVLFPAMSYAAQACTEGNGEL